MRYEQLLALRALIDAEVSACTGGRQNARRALELRDAIDRRLAGRDPEDDAPTLRRRLQLAAERDAGRTPGWPGGHG